MSALAWIHPTQPSRRRLLGASHVTFVAADLNRQSWLDRLVAEGFDPAKKTFVLWKGVVYHLDPKAVTATLGAVARLAPGSRIAFDYFSWRMVNGTDAPLYIRALRSKLTFTGEAWTFGIDTEPDARRIAAAFAGEHGLELAEWAPLGKPGKPLGGLVLATVPGRR